MRYKSTTQCECGQPGCVVRTAADYPLDDLPVQYRMIALLHAAGREIPEMVAMLAHKCLPPAIHDTHQNRVAVAMAKQRRRN